MVSKTAFGRFSLADLNGNCFLRPDRILGVFRVDNDVVDTFDNNSADQVRMEILRDSRIENQLAGFQLSTGYSFK